MQTNTNMNPPAKRAVKISEAAALLGVSESSVRRLISRGIINSTVNPVMGCNGCELWPKPAKFVGDMVNELKSAPVKSAVELRRIMSDVVGDRGTAEIYRDRLVIADKLQLKLELTQQQRQSLVDVVRRLCKCYAGHLGTNRAGHKGYADSFDQPKLFPGRMLEAAGWKAPARNEQDSKPWLAGAPRMIFVSDMGDALSTSIKFEYLRDEVVSNVTSTDGQRHLWLWLTKRPERMAEFGLWLADCGVAWPENLVAMTTVTSQSAVGRIDALRKVPARFKGLSVEPLFSAVNLNLTGIDWVIVGGGSDVLAEPFHVGWAMDIRQQCEAAGAAFFLKQLGKNPVLNESPLELDDPHGGDWEEWPEQLKIREIPDGFRNYKPEPNHNSLHLA